MREHDHINALWWECVHDFYTIKTCFCFSNDFNDGDRRDVFQN